MATHDRKAGIPLKRRACCFAAAALAVFAARDLHATVLTFDQIRESGIVVPTISGRAVPQDYGDRVTGSPMAVSGGAFTYGEQGEGFTPNVVAEYFGGSATPINPAVSLWVDQYGDLENVVIGNNNSNSLNVRLMADPGFAVLLYSFDLGGWPNTDYTITAVSVLDGGSALFSQSDVLVQGDFNGPRRTAFDFLTPLSGSELLIHIDYSNLPGSQHDNIGIDNIRFGQSPPPEPGTIGIPEPSSGLLLAAGLAVLLARRRT